MTTSHYEIIRALRLKRSLGTRVAAGYLRNKGFALKVALAILTTPFYRILEK